MTMMMTMMMALVTMMMTMTMTRMTMTRATDRFFVVCNNDASQRRVVRVHLFIINGPESMEEKVVLMPLCGVLHGEVWLVTNNVVDEVKSVGRQGWRENVLVVGYLIAWQEESFVVLSFNKSMSCVPIGLHSGKSHLPSIVLLGPNLLHYFHPLLLALDHDAFQVFDSKGDVFHSVPVRHQVGTHLLVDLRVGLISRFENEDGVSGPDNMASSTSMSSLQSLVSIWFKPKPGTVEGSRLLGIAHPPLKVVELEKPPPFRLRPLVGVVRSDGTIVVHCRGHPSLSQLWRGEM